MTDMSTCKECKFWNGTRLEEDAPQYTAGHCRRNPPTIIMVPDVAGGRAETRWPITSSYEWCGMFEQYDPRYKVVE